MEANYSARIAIAESRFRQASIFFESRGARPPNLVQPS